MAPRGATGQSTILRPSSETDGAVTIPIAHSSRMIPAVSGRSSARSSEFCARIAASTSRRKSAYTEPVSSRHPAHRALEQVHGAAPSCVSSRRKSAASSVAARVCRMRAFARGAARLPAARAKKLRERAAYTSADSASESAANTNSAAPSPLSARPISPSGRSQPAKYRASRSRCSISSASDRFSRIHSAK